MKKPSKESVLGFVPATHVGRDRVEVVQPATRKVESFALTPKQAALYGKITEENGFSMEASLKRLEQSKASKAQSKSSKISN